MVPPDLAPDSDWGWAADAEIGFVDGDELDRLVDVDGEVVLLLARSDGALWLHTKSFYPGGVWRLPTGKLADGESPDDGYARELGEEASIVPAPPAERIARVTYRSGDRSYRFQSYLYRIRNVDDPPVPADVSEQITEWRPATSAEVASTAQSLLALAEPWENWGRFRAQVHHVVTEIGERGVS